MSKPPSGEEIVYLQSNRAFIQPNGANPNNPMYFYGLSANYTIIQSDTNPRNGATTPHWTGSPTQQGTYRQIGRTKAPPGLPTATLHMYEKRGTLNRFLKSDCRVTVYNASGDCKDLSDLLSGWTNKIEIYADGDIGTINGGNRSDFATDAPITNQVALTLRERYEIGALGFGRIGDSDIAVEVLDVVYGSKVQCGSCGKANDGTSWIYFIQKHTASNESSVVYSTDGGLTTNVIDITGIGGTVDATAIDIAGSNLIVVATTENAYYYAAINPATGVPGAFTKVTTGFVSTKTPTDVLVYSANEVFFSANGGYLYESTNLAAGVNVLSAGGTTTSNLSRINGRDNTLVAVGVTGTVLISTTRGLTWGAAAAAPSANNNLGVDVLDASRYWVTDDAGGLYYTLDGGNSWTAKVLSGSPTAINDVVFANNEIGWACGTDGSGGLIWWTPNGGRDWSTANAAPRLNSVPSSSTFQKADRIAVPQVENSTVAANDVLICGLGATTDGIVLHGVANFF